MNVSDSICARMFDMSAILPIRSCIKQDPLLLLIVIVIIRIAHEMFFGLFIIIEVVVFTYYIFH